MAGGYVFVERWMEDEVRAQLDARVRTPPAPYAGFAYDGISFSLWSRRTTLEGVRLRGEGSVPGVTIRRIVAKAFDPAALERVARADRYVGGSGDGVMRPLATSVDIEELIVGADGGARLRVDRAAMDLVAIRQFDSVADLERVVAGKAADVAALVPAILRVARLDAADLTLGPPGKSDSGAAIERLSVDRYEGGRVQRLGARALRLEDGGKIATLAELTVEGCSPLAFLAAAIATGDPAAVAAAGEVSAVRLRELGGALVEQHGVRVGSVELSSSGSFRAGQRASQRLLVGGLDLSRGARPNSPLAVALGRLGYERAVVRVECETAVDPKDGRAEIGRCELGAQGVGRLTFSVLLTGIDLANPEAAGSADPGAEIMRRFGGATLHRAQISWRDDGITDRIIAAEARAAGLQTEDMRQRLRQNVAAQLLPLGATPRVVEFGRSIDTYLGAPATIAVALEPGRPAPFSEALSMIADPGRMLERLGLRSSTTPN
ncbi:MAG: hypothetical protein IPK81_00745 [Rhodospirillales bacterium]|nr:MAG: hypothetical protein IPK81_00745 [Rhodospirillales bacterium]